MGHKADSEKGRLVSYSSSYDPLRNGDEAVPAPALALHELALSGAGNWRSRVDKRAHNRQYYASSLPVLLWAAESAVRKAAIYCRRTNVPGRNHEQTAAN
jgi:hypothetical protein